MKFFHMQHTLWSSLFTSDIPAHYRIHHKMDERKLTIDRGDAPEGGGGSRTISGHTQVLFIYS